MPVIYVANSLGFNTMARTLVLPKVVSVLKKLGFKTIEPFADNNEASLARERSVEQEHQIARRDVEGVRNSDAVLCVISSQTPDEGAMIEVGMAIAWGMPVFILNDDFRYASNDGGFPMNLMLFAGMPVDRWREYYYTDVEDLGNPDKALMKWRG